MTTVTFKLDEPTAAWLRGEAARLGRPVSALLREAIERLREQRRDGSVLALVEDTIGSLDSGVSDLASNKAHLADFGRKSMAGETPR